MRSLRRDEPSTLHRTDLTTTVVVRRMDDGLQSISTLRDCNFYLSRLSPDLCRELDLFLRRTPICIRHCTPRCLFYTCAGRRWVLLLVTKEELRTPPTSHDELLRALWLVAGDDRDRYHPLEGGWHTHTFPLSDEVQDLYSHITRTEIHVANRWAQHGLSREVQTALEWQRADLRVLAELWERLIVPALWGPKLTSCRLLNKGRRERSSRLHPTSGRTRADRRRPGSRRPSRVSP